ncbi:MAG: ribonuclease HII [Hyphomicrobiales bacterium]|nr:ribonuclease HII [Rickettsiales bacterium]MCP5362122.1 ribonuclease HII [Hyphomicrobiales bacterium]
MTGGLKPYPSTAGAIIAGIDEAGRGPWAGPVTAAAVILPAGSTLPLRDSKKLSAPRREQLFEVIYQQAYVGVGMASVMEIDRLNILQATFLAMRRAYMNLGAVPHLAVVDGNRAPPLSCRVETVVRGDDTYLEIAAASIVAKVMRDRLMQRLHKRYPHFGWANNAGYGTKEHQEGLRLYGVSPHHRRSFAPVHALLEQKVVT